MCVCVCVCASVARGHSRPGDKRNCRRSDRISAACVHKKFGGTTGASSRRGACANTPGPGAVLWPCEVLRGPVYDNRKPGTPRDRETGKKNRKQSLDAIFFRPLSTLRVRAYTRVCVCALTRAAPFAYKYIHTHERVYYTRRVGVANARRVAPRTFERGIGFGAGAYTIMIYGFERHDPIACIYVYIHTHTHAYVYNATVGAAMAVHGAR